MFINCLKSIFVVLVLFFIWINVEAKPAKKIRHHIPGHAGFFSDAFYLIRKYLVLIFYLFSQKNKLVAEIFGYLGLTYFIRNI